MRLFALEFDKMKHKKILPLCILFVLIQAVFCYFSLARISAKPSWDAANAWPTLFADFALLNCILLTILTAVLASRTSDIEHHGSVWKMLLTQTTAGKLYFVKFLYCTVFLLLTILFQIVCMVISGTLLHFPPFPYAAFLSYCIGTFFVSWFVLSLQLSVSLLVQNQMVPLVIGLAGGGLGFIAQLFPAGVSRIVPWSYFMRVCPYLPDYSGAQMSYFPNPLTLSACIPILILTALICFVGCYLFCQKEQ